MPTFSLDEDPQSGSVVYLTVLTLAVAALQSLITIKVRLITHMIGLTDKLQINLEINPTFLDALKCALVFSTFWTFSSLNL